MSTRSKNNSDYNHPLQVLTGHRIFASQRSGMGNGIIVADDTGVRAYPSPDIVWRESSKGDFNPEHDPLMENGDWNPWFLLARALVLSHKSLKATELELVPVDSAEIAWRELRAAATARSMAADARLHAMCMPSSLHEIPIEAAASDRSFAQWFGEVMAGWFAAAEISRIELVVQFYRIAERLPEEIPAEITDLCLVIERVARRCNRVPTKGEILDEFATMKSIYGDEVRCRALRKRAGFQWLPQGKPGPKAIG